MNPRFQKDTQAPKCSTFSQTRTNSAHGRLWIALAEAERELGLPITEQQIAELKEHADDINYDVAAAREKRCGTTLWRTSTHTASSKTRDIHLGATSCYVGDNTDLIIMYDALRLILSKLVNAVSLLARFADKYKSLPTLGYTHFQPAQPTTGGKRACLWIQAFLMDIEEVEYRLKNARLLGSKGTTGTQASFLELFDGDHQKCKQLDKMIAEKMGFPECFAVSGQTYPRKLDSMILSTLSGIARAPRSFQTISGCCSI